MSRTDMYVEYDAWHAVCFELESLGIPPNNSDNLINAIKRWAEELVKLSIEDPNKDHQRERLAIARRKYPDIAEKACQFREAKRNAV